MQWILLLLLSISTAHAYVDEVVPSLETFSGYRPTYFVIGTPDAQIQLSFKAHLVKQVPVYFGYSQLIAWDLFKDSAPIRDVNYNPDLFYRLQTGSGGREQYVDFGFFEHESNGKDGGGSRAWNRAYLRFSDTFHLGGASSERLHWSFKLAAPYTVEPQNYPEYRGIWELNVSVADILGDFFEKDDFTVRVFPGGPSWVNPFQGGQEIIVRLKAAKRDFLPLFVFQFFHGYAANMLDYRRTETCWRVGVGF